MRFLIVLLGILLLLGAVSCDRFEHKFTNPFGDEEVQILIDLELALAQVSAEDQSPLADIYAENYIHNGVNKADRMAWFGAFFTEAEDVSFRLLETHGDNLDDTTSVINWRLQVLSGESVLADSIFTGERARFDGTRWLLQGNGVCTGATPKQLVIAEYFTFRTCPNCPQAEAKLYELEQQYDNFIYLEHHTMMELMVPGNDTYSYYGNNPAPSAVINGQYLVNGSSDAALGAYESLVAQEAAIDAPIIYGISDISQGGGVMLSANVSLDLQMPIDMQNLYLNYVLITNDVSYTNIQGQPLHNVVRAVGRKSLAGQNLQEIPISLHVSSGIPSNARLVVFVQYRPENFDNDAKIYGGAVVAVN